MAVRATLEAPGSSNYRVIRFSYEFDQQVDPNYIPREVPRGGTIHLVIEAINDTSILAWMLGTDRPSAGRITVVDRESTTLRNIHFQGGHCVHYKEEFDFFDEKPLQIHFTVACQRIEINDMVHQQITWTENSSTIEGGDSPTRVESSPSSESSSSSSSDGGVSSFNPND